MYIPAENRWTDHAAILRFMQENAFAILATAGDAGLQATHLPFVVDDNNGQLILHTHLAKANSQAKALLAGVEAMVVFSGPHAYISPTHYDRADSVPTWNYAAVHAYGNAEAVTEEERWEGLHRLMAQSEPGWEAHWAGVSDRYKTGLAQGIVPLRIRVQRLDAKLKASQNKSADERARMVQTLEATDDSAARAMASLMRGVV